MREQRFKNMAAGIRRSRFLYVRCSDALYHVY